MYYIRQPLFLIFLKKNSLRKKGKKPWLYGIGVVKTKTGYMFFNKSYSWFIHRLSSKFYLVDIFKIPNKIKQNPNFPIPNPLSYHISSKPTKIKHLNHFTTKKSNFHLAKNLPTNLKSSLFIGTFTDNDFHSKNSKSYPQHRGLP